MMTPLVRFLVLALAVSGSLFGAVGLFSDVTPLAFAGVVLAVAAAMIAVSSRRGAPEPPARPTLVQEPPASAEPPIAEKPSGAGLGSSQELPAAAPQAPPAEIGQPAVPHPPASRPARLFAPRSSEPDEVVASFAHAASGAGRVLAAHLWLEDAPSTTLRLVASFGPQPPSHEPVEIENSTLGYAFTTGTATIRVEPDLSGDAHSEPVWRFAVPIGAGEVRGAAALDVAATHPDRGALTSVAAAFRGPLAGALALYVARQESRASRELLRTSRDLSRLQDPVAIAQALLARAVELADAQSGSVMLADDTGGLSIVASHGLPDAVVRETRVEAGEGIAGWVLTSGKPLVVEDLQDRGARSRRHGIRSAVAVPIADDDGVLGVLNVGSKEFHARFSRSHVDALEAIGRVGAAALRTATATNASADRCLETLKALALALEAKDPFSRGTTERVIGVTTALGELLGLDVAQRRALKTAALLRDVGMAAVGDAARVCDRPLTTVEWGMLKLHPVIAADVLSEAAALKEAVPIVYHHHEHFDGTGYVAGIAGEVIPIGARILAVADAFVSMTSRRPYRPSRTSEEALLEIQTYAGIQFDPTVVRALEELLIQAQGADKPRA